MSEPTANKTTDLSGEKPSRRLLRRRRSAAQPGGSRRAALLAGLAMALSGLVYPTIIAEALTGWPLPVSSSYLSEYSARTMPFSMWFRVLDATAGTLAVVGAVAFLGVASSARWSWWHRISGWLLLTFGAGTICDALLPLDCAVTQRWCARLEEAGQLSIEHHIHVVTSSIATGAAMAFAFVVVVMWWRRGSGPRPSRLAAGIAAIAVASNVWFLVAYVLLGQVAGVAQRVNVTMFAVLLMVMGLQLVRRLR